MNDEFVGGALLFKGDKKKKKKAKKRKLQNELAPLSISHHEQETAGEDAGITADEAPAAKDSATALLSDLTEAERKALKRRREREMKDLENVAKKSHRERVEEFNEKLGKLTEHNDIPRVCFYYYYYYYEILGSTHCFVWKRLALLFVVCYLTFFLFCAIHSGERCGQWIVVRNALTGFFFRPCQTETN